MKRPLWYRLRNLVESNPYIWYVAWKLSHYLPLILPHDKIYLAMHYFNLTPGDLILDVGANDGISALSIYHVDPNLRIFSIEANAIHERALAKIKAKQPSFDYLIAGAGREIGSLTLYTPRYHSILLHTFASSNERRAKEGIVETFGLHVGELIEMISSQIAIIPIDDLKLTPKVIKIDVEGFEYSVLQGARNTILECRPFIIIEADHNEGGEVLQFLKELNYVVLDYDYERDTFQELSLSIGRPNLNRNHIVVPAEKLPTLPIDSSNE